MNLNGRKSAALGKMDNFHGCPFSMGRNMGNHQVISIIAMSIVECPLHRYPNYLVIITITIYRS
jgi:hypothetical protein